MCVSFTLSTCKLEGEGGGDLEDVVLVGDTVEHGVQRVEEISHLGRWLCKLCKSTLMHLCGDALIDNVHEADNVTEVDGDRLKVERLQVPGFLVVLEKHHQSAHLFAKY